MTADGWRDDDVVMAWAGLIRLHADLVPDIDAALKEATGLPLGWYDVLLELSSAPDRRLRMLDLAEAVVLSRTRVSRVVDALEAAGYVSRSANPDDRRSAFAELTPAGRSAFRRAAPIYLRLIRERFGSRLTKADAATLRRILTQAMCPDATTR